MPTSSDDRSCGLTVPEAALHIVPVRRQPLLTIGAAAGLAAPAR